MLIFIHHSKYIQGTTSNVSSKSEMNSDLLHTELAKRTMDGDLFFSPPDSDRIVCVACAHRCKIKSGKAGICRVRFNDHGILKVPGNYVSSLHADPIEKKPFYHAYPKTLAMSFGMLGCDLHCGYCQNWITSQVLKDNKAGVPPQHIAPSDIVDQAMYVGARSIISTYNEPLITAEWAMQIFELAKQDGFATGFVSNGNATPEVLDYIRPYTDLYKIDLKTFSDRQYRQLGARLEKILTGIRQVYKRGYWMEIVTLLVPGFNDSTTEIRDIAGFIAGINPNIPWHVTAFHPDYKMTDARRTSRNDLIRAVTIGYEMGLNYVYAGNLPGRVGKWEDTRCHNCTETLVHRNGYHILDYRIDDDGRCPACRTEIPGKWETPSPKERLFYTL